MASPTRAAVGKKRKPLLGTSKLKKWSCDCGVNARIAAKEFYAICGKCDSIFELQEAAGGDLKDAEGGED
jgi:hypothetical protein